MYDDRTSDSTNNPSYEAILAASKELFLERGFPATSMAAIAERAGVVRATIYNNFDDMEAIVGEIMRRYVAGYVAIPQQLREEAMPDQTPADLIEAMIRRAISWRIENAELRPLIDLTKHLPSSPWGALDAKADEAMYGWILEIHSESARRGLLRAGLDLEFSTKALYAMIEAVLSSFDVAAAKRQIDDAVRQLTLLHWHALYVVEPDEVGPAFRMTGQRRRSRRPLQKTER
jgi:AcrR family transcriptional regulator